MTVVNICGRFRGCLCHSNEIDVQVVCKLTMFIIQPFRYVITCSPGSSCSKGITHWIVQLVFLIHVHWIAIYPVDNATHL